MDKFLKDLQKLETNLKKKIEKESGTRDVKDFLTDEFLQTHTDIRSLDEFMDLAGIEDQTDFDTKTPELDEVTQKHSNFKNFDSLLEEAVAEYMEKSLDDLF